MWRVGKAPDSKLVLENESLAAECSTREIAARIVAAMNAAEVMPCVHCLSELHTTEHHTFVGPWCKPAPVAEAPASMLDNVFTLAKRCEALTAERDRLAAENAELTSGFRYASLREERDRLRAELETCKSVFRDIVRHNDQFGTRSLEDKWAREALAKLGWKRPAEPARKAVCHDCGGPILHTWCLEVAAKQRALGMPEHAPVRCVDCLWTRICRIADANG